MNRVLKMTEVQPQLSRVLQNHTDVTQVVYGRRNEPIVALVPWLLYSSWKERFLRLRRGEEELLVLKTLNVNEVTRLFLSYRERLAPLLRPSDTTRHVVEVLVHGEPVGAILTWEDWLRFAPPRASTFEAQDVEDVSTHERTFTIVTAAKHMAQFSAQFERERKSGHVEAIAVTKRGTPVFAIVPWSLYVAFLEETLLREREE